MLRWDGQSLGLASVAGGAAGLWSLLGPAASWQAQHPFATAALGAVAMSVSVGLFHQAWPRLTPRRWQPLPQPHGHASPRPCERPRQLRLRERERHRLEAILDVLGDAVLVTAADETVQLANAAAAKLLHLPRSSVHRQPVERVVRDRRLLQLIREAHENVDGLVQRHLEHRMTDDGRPAVFDVTLAGLARQAAAHPDPPDTCMNPSADWCTATTIDLPPDAWAGEAATAGCNGGVVAILRDVTRQRCVAEMHSDFVSSVSHELRTPLSSIKAYMEMLVDGEAQDEFTRQEFYVIIQTETHRLTRLIDNVLNISRIEAGLVRVQSETVDLHVLALQAIGLIQPQARAAKVTVHGPAVEPACQAVADRDMLLQAMLNLLSNAVKYTPAGGRVDVQLRASRRAETVEVSVSDTGAGIPEADLPFVFDKFYRVPEHKPLAKGTGLGLNLVKHVVETVHGGKLSVTSQPGAGSTFTFRLSMAEKGKAPEPSPAAGASMERPAGADAQACSPAFTAGKDQT